jgi:adenosylcobinamide-GDP ribazoletransferase
VGAVSQVWRRLGSDVAANLGFFTRLPLGSAAPGAPDFRRIGWATPLAGALIGLLGAIVLMAARAASLPSLVSAVLAVAAQVVVTGALHEDGLADVADGFGGGRDRESKLAILRDSRIGTYGAAALVFDLMLRVATVAALTRPSAAYAGAALMLAGAIARGAALGPLAWLPPARRDGVGARAASLGPFSLRPAAVTLAALALALGLFELGVVRALFAFVIAAAVARLFAELARRHIGGQTGDVCGAAAALAELATLLALLIGGRDA